MAEFGSLGAVLAATPARLMSASRGDIGAVREIRFFRRTMAVALRSAARARPLVPDGDTTILEYLRLTSAWLLHEQVRLLHFDRQLTLRHDEVIAIGTIDHAPIYCREVIRRALDLGSAALILAHNHPSGDPTPSKADIEITKRVARACDLFGITLHDHVIVAVDGYASFRALGLL